MSQVPDEILFDVRLIERHIRKGLITKEQVDARLQQLRDAADEAAVLELDTLQQSLASAAPAATSPQSAG